MSQAELCNSHQGSRVKARSWKAGVNQKYINKNEFHIIKLEPITAEHGVAMCSLEGQMCQLFLNTSKPKEAGHPDNQPSGNHIHETDTRQGQHVPLGALVS